MPVVKLIERVYAFIHPLMEGMHLLLLMTMSVSQTYLLLMLMSVSQTHLPMIMAVLVSQTHLRSVGGLLGKFDFYIGFIATCERPYRDYIGHVWL